MRICWVGWVALAYVACDAVIHWRRDRSPESVLHLKEQVAA